MTKNINNCDELLLKYKDLKEKLEQNEKNKNIEKALAEANPDAIFLLDKEGNFLKFIPNTNFDSYIVPPEVFIGKNIKDIFSEELSNIFFDSFKKLFETQKMQVIEYVLFEKYYEARFVISEKNKVISIVRNITETQKNKIELKNKNDFLLDVLENMTDAFISLDKNWNYTYINKKASEIFNIEPKNIIGKNIWEEFPENVGEHFKVNYKKAMREQISIQMEEYYEPYDRWFENSIVPSKEGLNIFFQDITSRKKSEFELENTMNRYYNLFQNSPNAIFINTNNKVTMLNKACLELFGAKKEEELLGKNPLDLFISEDSGEIKKRILRLQSPETNVPLREETILRLDGEKVDVEVLASSFIENGEIHIHVSLTDISKRKKLEIELNQKEKRFKALVENAPDAIILVGMDGQIKYASPSIKQLGYTPEYFITLAPNDLTHPDDLPMVLDTIMEVAQNPSKIKTIQYRFKDINNNWIWLESTFSNRLYDPEIEAIIINSRGISDRKIVEENLIKNEEKYRFLIENILDVVWVFDVESLKMKFISPSVEKLTGYTVDEALNQTMGEMFTTESLKGVKIAITEKVETFLKTGKKEVYTYEFEQLHKGGYSFWVEMITYLRVNPKTTKLEIIGTSRNINSRKLAEKELKENEAKFSKIFDCNPDMVLLTEIETGEIIDLNETFVKITGHNKKDIVGKTTIEINLWKNELERTSFINLLKEKNSIRGFELNLFKKSKEDMDTLVSAEIIELNNKKCILVIITDVTEQKKIREKLESERLRLKTLFDTTQEHIFIKDTKGIYLACNKKVENVFGAKEKNIIGKTDYDFLPTEIANNYRKNDLNVINSKKPLKLIGNIIYPDGHKEISETTLTPIFDSLENVIGIIGIAYDITELYNSQQEIKDREEIYSAIVNQANDSIALIDTITGEFIEFNEEIYKSLGYTKEEFKGMKISDINSEHSQDYIKNNIEFLISNGGGVFETKHRRKNGEIKEVRVSTKYIEIKNKGYFAVIISDITENKKIEKIIKDSESRLKEAQSLAKLGSWELDLKTNKLSWSDEIFHIFEIDKNKFEASYEAFLNAIHPDDREIVNQAYNDSIKNKTNYSIVHKLLMKDGSIKHVQEIGHTEYDFEGMPSISMGTVQDITDRVKIEEEIKLLNQNLEEKVKERTEQLEQTNKDLESFTYSVSHDLRSPLRHIDGFTKLLKNSIKNPTEDSVRYFDKIIQSANKMSGMIDDLLKFSRLGRKVLEKSNVDLNILVNQVIEQYKIDFGDRKIEFIVGNLPTIRGDIGLLQVVFENLISNAIKFTSKKDFAVIEINTCNQNNRNCTVYIKDNGAGFDMAYVDKLFGVFQRLHTESEFSGTGIGLANIKQIIQKHGGKIYAEGEIDKGATFYLSL
jgi:PAS domain S-box-containing protein